MTPANITSGFKRTRKFPFDEHVFDDLDFAPSAVTNWPCPDNTKQVVNLEAGVSHENAKLLPSTNGFGFQSPQEIKGYPKAIPRKESGKGQRKGRSMIATDTPEKEAFAQCKPKDQTYGTSGDFVKDTRSKPGPKKCLKRIHHLGKN